MRHIEVVECGSCYEGADGYQYNTGDNADNVGDLCSDTKGTSKNFSCADPDGQDCQSNNWEGTDYHNYMGYANDDCYNLDGQGFTSQQSGRIHGWIMDKYQGLVEDSDGGRIFNSDFRVDVFLRDFGFRVAVVLMASGSSSLRARPSPRDILNRTSSQPRRGILPESPCHLVHC